MTPQQGISKSASSSLMFQWTSITEWLHPAVPPVKTPPFFGKYFHSAIIASICSYTVATLAVSLRLSEFTAKTGGECVCVSVNAGVCHWGFSIEKAYSAGVDEKGTEISSIEGGCDEAGRVSCSSSSTTTHTSARRLLHLFDGWFNRVDFCRWAVCANAIWLVPLKGVQTAK